MENQSLDRIIARLGELPTSNISDAMDRSGGMSPVIRPMYPAAKCCGPAYTVLNHPKDNLMSHFALEFSRPGQVLVLDGRCGRSGSGWGELMSIAARNKGLAGIVIDGTVRDVQELEEIGFPVFARGVQAEGTFKNTPGQVDCPVSCGGLSVLPGDVIVGDENGVIVVPKSQAGSVLEAALKIQARENEIRSKLSDGDSLFNLLNIRALFEKQTESR